MSQYNCIAITGGAGFIGSHIVEGVVAAWPNAQTRIIDRMTYAADIRNIMPLYEQNRVELMVGDISDPDFSKKALAGVDLLIHAAAESHVDNSFGNSLLFTKTNVLGTHVLMEASRLYNIPRIIHVSTDEVYGEIAEGEFDETAILHPTNPYSASKAAAEMIISGYRMSYQLPVVIVRANNIFGTRQYPEKIIPKFSLYLQHGLKLPVHGTGKNARHYVAVEDFVEGLLLLVREGIVGEAYNIGSQEEYTNLEVAKMICDQFNISAADAIEFVLDRPFNDRRYSVATHKINAMGWRPRRSLRQEIGRVVRWYVDHGSRYAAVVKEAQG